MMGHGWMNAGGEALFLRHEMERCDRLARELDELEREAPTDALREEVRQMKRQVEAVRHVLLGWMPSDA